MSRFGELLKEARKRTKLTQQELGGKVPVDGSYISKMETGKEPPPTRDVAVKLADALGIIDKIRRLVFFLAAYVAGDEDMEGLTLVEVAGEEAASGVQLAIAGAEAFGAGVGLDTQDIGLIVKQIVAEAQLPPEKMMLAGRLIEEHARAVCHVLATEQDQ
jgi:transcriptional regulator with XRE-family HTH domain